MPNELTPFARVAKPSYLTWLGKLRSTSVVGDHILYYATSDGFVMCHICAQHAIDDAPNFHVFPPVSFGINYDNPNLRCEDCRDYIEMVDQPAYDLWCDEQEKAMANCHLLEHKYRD